MKGLITNQWDRDNLNFLLNTKGEDFADWHAQADEEDLNYARELMDAYSLELKLRSELLEIEARMTDFDQAKSVLDRIAKL